MSHRDMARPPHEDPEYLRQLALEAEARVVNVIETPAVRAPQTSLLKIRNGEQSFTLCPSSPPSVVIINNELINNLVHRVDKQCSRTSFELKMAREHGLSLKLFICEY